MAEFSYKNDLNGGSLMVRESRAIANLLLRNTSSEEWTQEIQVNNLLQKRSPATAKRNVRAIRKRLQPMEPEFWRALRDGDNELATQVSFSAALGRNLLLVEFMEQVVRDAFITQAEKLELYQWLDFLDCCANRDSGIDRWRESTKKKMGQVVFRMLAETGYLKSTRTLELQNVRVRPEVKTMLDQNFKQRIKNCMEVSLIA